MIIYDIIAINILGSRFQKQYFQCHKLSLVAAVLLLMVQIFIDYKRPLTQQILDGHTTYKISQALHIQNKRRQRMGQECSKIHPIGIKQQKRYHKQLMVDDKHRIAYCYIPKAGSSHWRRTLTKFKYPHLKQSYIHIMYNNHSGYLGHSRFNETMRTYIMNYYFKFTFVRNPYSRLYSAYVDKLCQHRPHDINYQKIYGTEIMKRYRPNASAIEKQTGWTVTFEEFLRYVTDGLHEGRMMDHHWETYEHLCNPCKINYDFIGDIESQNNEESNALLHIIGADIAVFPSGRNKTKKEKLRDAYSKIPQYVIERVKEEFKNDFKLFGYDINTFDSL